MQNLPCEKSCEIKGGSQEIVLMFNGNFNNNNSGKFCV